MLIAGMLSTLPALLINSLVSPIIINLLGLSVTDEYSLGFGMILFLSAPIGEEISKALAVLCLARFIDSSKRGFQIGFSVGLGFALLENMTYILNSLLTGEGAAVSFVFTAVLRAIGSIPGHATWTAISGYAIGKYVVSKRGNKSSKNIFDDTSSLTDSQWILFDNKSGLPIISSKTRKLPNLPFWLSAGRQKMVKITDKPVIAVAIAIIFHAIWNGSLWSMSVLMKDSSIILQLLSNMTMIFLLILILWIILRRLIPFAVLTD